MYYSIANSSRPATILKRSESVGRKNIAQRVSAGKEFKRPRAPERGERVLPHSVFRPVPGLINRLRKPTAHARGLSPCGLGVTLRGCGLPLCGAANPRRRNAGPYLKGCPTPKRPGANISLVGKPHNVTSPRHSAIR